MGLLSRIAGQFKTDMPMRGMASDAMQGMAYGGVGGALAGGAAGSSMDPEMQALVNPATGLVGGMAGGAALGAAGGMRHIIMTLARALKQQNPQASDEMILQKAMEIAKQQGGQGDGMMPPMGGMPPGGPGGGMGGM